jgi:hypothetical protein
VATIPSAVARWDFRFRVGRAARRFAVLEHLRRGTRRFDPQLPPHAFRAFCLLGSRPKAERFHPPPSSHDAQGKTL